MATVLEIALQWRKLREERVARQKEVDLLKETEDSLKKQIIERLAKAKNKSASNGERLFQIITKEEPAAENWPAIYKHIQDTGEFDLLERRINKKALKERKDLGVKIAGVQWFPVDTLSDTKAK